MKTVEKYLGVITERFKPWAKQYNYRLILFNLILIFLFLLHSVGYFHPYLPISINIIVFTAVLLSVFLLGAKSRALFIVALIFWLVTMFFKIVGVETWAERTGIYVYQIFIVGVITLLYEYQTIFRKK